LPDSRRPLRRTTSSRLISRAVAHLSVVALIAVTSAIGLAATGPDDDAAAPRSGEPFAFGLITTARGAASEAEPLRAMTIEIAADPERENLTVARRMPLPTAEPLPTPVAPSETPIPDAAPAAATGQTTTAPAPQPPPAPATTKLAWPVPGGSVSQYFHGGHRAIDIAAPYGSTVVAAAEGRVTWAGWRNNGGGLVVAIDHGNGLVTRYNHLGSIWVGPGQWVARGQGIAGVGCTGICTGPHVHFETILNGVAINPLRLM
jgi:murein DD-endopeptidase MepM/ murein hydrolase activator NlpD